MSYFREKTTRCPKGHSYDRVTTPRKAGAKPQKWCSQCQRASSRRSEQSRRQHQPSTYQPQVTA